MRKRTVKENKEVKEPEETEEDEIVKIASACGAEIEFIVMDYALVDGLTYAYLKTKDKVDGIPEKMVLPFLVTEAADGSKTFDMVNDEEIIEKLSKLYK